MILGTTIVHMKDDWGHIQEVGVLIDSGSQVSAITATCAQKLGLKISKWTVPLCGLPDIPIPAISGVVKCTTTPRYSIDPEVLSRRGCCRTSPIICQDDRWIRPSKKKCSHLVLADPSFDECGPVEILLGADVFSNVMNGKRIVVRSDLPIAFGLIFG